jgi:hypothetical protein
MYIDSDDKFSPVFCHQAVHEGCHQDLGEVGSDTEPETSTEGHKMLGSSGDFHLILLKRMLRGVTSESTLKNRTLNFRVHAACLRSK